MSSHATQARAKVDISGWQHKRTENGQHFCKHKETGIETPAFQKPGPAFDAARVLQQAQETGQLTVEEIVEDAEVPDFKMPPDLINSGWMMRRNGKKFQCVNRTAQMDTVPCDNPEDARAQARHLQYQSRQQDTPAKREFVEPPVTEIEPPDVEIIIARLDFVETQVELEQAIAEERLQAIIKDESDPRFTDEENAQIWASLHSCAARLGTELRAPFTPQNSVAEETLQSAQIGELEADSQNGANNIPKIIPQSAGLKPQSVTTLLDPGAIRTDGETQVRATLNDATVERYAEAMREGAVFPDIIVFWDGKDYWPGDGFHRLAATERAELAEINAEVRQGTQRDALLYAVGANALHGLPRTDADKRRAVETLLRDDEWSKWSNREIARRAGVTHSFVGDVRESLSGVRTQMEVKARRGDSEYTVSTTNLAGRKTDTVADSSPSNEDEKHATTPAEAHTDSPAAELPVASSAEVEGLHSSTQSEPAAGASSITVKDTRRFVESAQSQPTAQKPDRMTAIEKRLKGRSLVITHTLMPKGLGVMVTINVSGAAPSDALNSSLFPVDKVMKLGETEYELIMQRLDAEKSKPQPKAAQKKTATKGASKAATAKKPAPEQAKGKAWDKSPLNPAQFKKGSKLALNVSGRDQQAEVVGVAPDDNRKLRVKIGVKTYDFFVAELPLSKGGAKKGTTAAKVFRIIEAIKAANTPGQLTNAEAHYGLGTLTRFSDSDAKLISDALAARRKALGGATKKTATGRK